MRSLLLSTDTYIQIHKIHVMYERKTMGGREGGREREWKSWREEGEREGEREGGRKREEEGGRKGE